MAHNPFNTLQEFKIGDKKGKFYSLPALEKAGVGPVSRLPVSIRIVLESVLRNCDGKKVTEEHVRQLAGWKPNAARTEEIPFVLARIVLQDFTGVPLLADLAAMRDTAVAQGCDPKRVEPMVPVDLVVDHSVMIDYYGSPAALDLNMKLEFQRNAERYQFMKWGMQAFDTFKVVPPGIGIVHQELSLCPNLDVAENIFADRQPANALGLVRRGELRRRTQELLDHSLQCVQTLSDQAARIAWTWFLVLLRNELAPQAFPALAKRCQSLREATIQANRDQQPLLLL